MKVVYTIQLILERLIGNRFVGGIAGAVTGNGVIKDCINRGKSIGSANFGGVCPGFWGGGREENCRNEYTEN